LKHRTRFQFQLNRNAIALVDTAQQIGNQSKRMNNNYPSKLFISHSISLFFKKIVCISAEQFALHSTDVSQSLFAPEVGQVDKRSPAICRGWRLVPIVFVRYCSCS
jgi:hypothetical protein